MCGIYGYIGKLDAYDEVYKGLKLLQYRGYDSCGIAYFDNTIKAVKAVGPLENLTKPQAKSNLAFGHTRWATNGEVNLSNTHPHHSFDNEFYVVHNGIITNAEELKNSILKNVDFSSDTDTEVVVNLLSVLDGNVDNRIKELPKYLKGSYALIISHDRTIYVLKNFSPINILKNEDGIYISSDIASLKSGKLYQLKDFDILKIEDNNIINLNGEVVKFSSYENDIEKLNLGSFKHFMQKEIFETPKAIRETYDHIKDLNFKDYIKGIKHISFVGCGTAYHSCLIGAELFKKLGFEVDCELASNITITKRIRHNHLYLIVSQSGETADCIKVAEQVKRYGGKILVITNEAKSSITRFTDKIIATKANKEIAVASTKTYSCQLFTFAYMCHKLENKNYTLDMDAFENSLKTYVNNINVSALANMLKSKDKMILIAKDIDYLTIQEASLKIREIDYVYTLPIYSGELKHGTLSLIDNDSIVLSLNSSTDKNKLNNAINEIESRGGTVVKMEQYIKAENTDDFYKPIYSIIPFQLLSYEIAIKRNLNPDMPRNLAKSVTVE